MEGPGGCLNFGQGAVSFGVVTLVRCFTLAWLAFSWPPVGSSSRDFV